MRRTFDTIFILLGIAIVAIFTTRYVMPFRLDDVLLMDWSMKHRWFDAFDPIRGQLINSYRPLYALTAFMLSHAAGWYHPFWWHVTLSGLLITGLAFTGLTARVVSDRWYTTELSAVLYFAGFLSILNVFFWYSDLTYALELGFTAPAWYFLLRGLTEGRLGLWWVGLCFATCAVLSKEPAFVLIHVVTLGTVVLTWRKIAPKWSPADRWKAFAGYALLVGLTLFIALVSPTRSNRFISFSSPDVRELIQARASYYSSIYLSLTGRMLVIFPVLYATVISLARGRVGRGVKLCLGAMIAALVLAVLSTNVLLTLAGLTVLLGLSALMPNAERERARRLLPFLACIDIAALTLLITSQLVKTQLTEIAFLSTILASWGWAVWLEDARVMIGPVWSAFPKATERIISAGGLCLVVVGAYVGMPKALHQERVLREVRDVRWNANDAVAWAARELPHGATLATTLYSLHGIDHLDALTSKDDETKLRQQYTFDGGFVYYCVEDLGRYDIVHAYLADTAMLPRVLEGLRTMGTGYILLQTELDLDLLKKSSATRPALIRSTSEGGRDTLVARFSRGPYPCEIWQLR